MDDEFEDPPFTPREMAILGAVVTLTVLIAVLVGLGLHTAIQRLIAV